MRRSRHHRQKIPDHGRITETVSIRERPAEAEDRAVPGHWEGDLFFGSHNSQIATLVERQTRYVMLVRVTSKDSETVIDALIKQAHKLPRELYKSLIWDRGSEMTEHRRFSLATDIEVYFCDPQQPWQRGSNENTNGRCVSTSQKEPTCRILARPSSMQLHVGRTSVLAKRSTSKLRRNALANVLNPQPEAAVQGAATALDLLTYNESRGLVISGFVGFIAAAWIDLF
jgi:hypothetical protein